MLLHFAGVGLQVLQQLAGINTVMYYTPVILELAGIHDKRTALLVRPSEPFFTFYILFPLWFFPPFLVTAGTGHACSAPACVRSVPLCFEISTNPLVYVSNVVFLLLSFWQACQASGFAGAMDGSCQWTQHACRVCVLYFLKLFHFFLQSLNFSSRMCPCQRMGRCIAVSSCGSRADVMCRHVRTGCFGASCRECARHCRGNGLHRQVRQEVWLETLTALK